MSQYAQSLVCSERASILNLFSVVRFKLQCAIVFQCVLKDGCTVKCLVCKYQHGLLMYLLLLCDENIRFTLCEPRHAVYHS